MSEKDKNKSKTFKEKLKDRVSLMKQKSTELLLNSTTTKHLNQNEERIHMQGVVDSLLPGPLQEEEIQQALNDYAGNSRIKETSKQLNKVRKNQDDFFTSTGVQDMTDFSPAPKKKTDTNENPDFAIDVIDSEKVSPAKIGSNYFDLELNKPDLITDFIISKIDYQKDAKHLFWDGKRQSVGASNKDHYEEDGLVKNDKLQKNSSHIEAILSCSVDSSDWFNENGELITLKFDKREINTKGEDFRIILKDQSDILTRFLESELINERNPGLEPKPEIIRSKLLEIDLSSMKFYHHHLFSLEHILASILLQNYDLYFKIQSEKTLATLKEKINISRNEINNFKGELFKESNGNHKKVYKNHTFQKMVKDLSISRKTYAKESLRQKELENGILKSWRLIKYVRKQLKFISTDVVLEVVRKNTNTEEDERNWEIMSDLQVSDTLNELKCEYFEKRALYNKATPELQNEMEKPILDIDEKRLKRKIFNDMCEVFRQPGDPILFFNLRRNPNLITEQPLHKNELSRRNDVDKTKYIFKLKINNQDVCKTKPIILSQDFVVDFKTSFSIEIPENTPNLEVFIFEQNSLLNPNLIANFKIDLPNESSFISKATPTDYSFDITYNRTNNHFGVGNCKTISEMINKKLTEFKLGNIDLENNLLPKGIVSIKMGWNRDIRNNTTLNLNNDSVISQRPSKDTLVKLFDKVLDPNDPKHMFLNTFFRNFNETMLWTNNFYINDYFNFNMLSNEKQVGKQTSIINVGYNSVQTFNYRTDSASGRVSRSLRESVLDDVSMSNKLLEPIELQTRMSRRYLELINEYIMMNTNGEKEKDLQDILTFVEYHKISNIRMDFLRPRQPLFHLSNSKQPSVSLKGSIEHTKEYFLKVCILKAFQLPQRTDESNSDESGVLKMISLRPFVQVSCQGTNFRTFTAVGNNPTWNQQLFFTVKNEESSEVNLYLFDEIYEDLLEDNRLENSTVHGQYNAKWLASLKIPLRNIITQPKLEGNFSMYSPVEVLGYKQSIDGQYSMVSNGFQKNMTEKLKGGFYVSLLLETNPNYRYESQTLKQLLESNEMEYLIRYLTTFTDIYNSQFPARKINLLVLDKSGKYISITRLFKALPLPDFAECIRNFSKANYSNIEDSEHSSKSSTPKKKKRSPDGEDVTSQSIKSLLSGGETGRQSKGTKDNFDLRSLNDVLNDSEKELALKINACVRFVSLIPLFEAYNNSVALTGYQTLHLSLGCMLDHVILLMSYFLQLGVECWCVSGFSLSKGQSSYVLVRENHNDNSMRMSKTSWSSIKNIHWTYYVYDASAGVKYNVKDPFCPLQKIYSVCNNENVWVNIQPSERSSLVKFNLNDTSEWRPVFQKQIMACPAPLPGGPAEDKLYTYPTQDVIRLKELIEEKIKVKIQRWRGHRKTIWNRNCSSMLRESLINWEKWCLNPSTNKPKLNRKLQQLMMSYQIYGFPYNTTYTSMRDIVSNVKSTKIHLDEHAHAEFALAVEVFPYPNRIYSVWIYICSLVKKTEV